jgi:hypothetical protein
MRYLTSLLLVITASGIPSTAHAQHIPLVIEHGWNTNLHKLAPISADSKIGKEFPNQKMVVGFAYDEYWLVIPLWNSRGSFVICEDFPPPENPAQYWILEEQGAEAVSTATGVPGGRLGKPSLYYVPWGWILLAGIAVLVKFMSGPGPHKRFRRLWSEPSYRAAMANLLEVEESRLPADFETIVLERLPRDPSERIDEVVEWLGQQGIGRRRATRDLEFLLGYLVDNEKLTVAPPPEDTSPPQAPGPEEPTP